MYLSRGTTADFVRAIPIVVISCLVTSYVFALLVSPVLARLLLGSGKSRGAGLGVGFATGVARLAVGRPVATLGLAGLAAGLCALGGLALPRQFFPDADRNQLIVTLELPEGTHILTSDAAARRLEDELKEHSRVRTVTTFVGRAPPLFYYNINRRPSSPHLAQLVVETVSIPALRSVSEHIRGFANSDLPAVALGVRRLSQGMPIDAPIEIRVYASDRAALQRAGEAVLAEVRAIAGTADVHHDLGLGVPTLEFEVNDAAARRKGISRADIALALRSRSRGLAVGEYHGGSDPVPIVIRSAEGEDFPVSRLTAIAVSAPGGQEVPLAHLASIGVGWRPGAIHRRQGRNLVTVSAQLEEGVTAHAVMRKLRPALERLQLPEGVALEFGGETEGSQTANAELFRHFPLAFVLLVACLLAEFNSFRTLLIILVTVPLAIFGTIPGLLLSGSPFGFMSLLGALSLVGIVVNNAIVLLDAVQRRRREGAPLEEALIAAIELRTRPIVLTMLTTAAGMLPLALSRSELWPPMAWAIISGLAVATALTLAVVPALYVLAFGSELRKGGARA